MQSSDVYKSYGLFVLKMELLLILFTESIKTTEIGRFGFISQLWAGILSYIRN